jgi:hypothetical protein
MLAISNAAESMTVNNLIKTGVIIYSASVAGKISVSQISKK